MVKIKAFLPSTHHELSTTFSFTETSYKSYNHLFLSHLGMYLYVTRVRSQFVSYKVTNLEQYSGTPLINNTPKLRTLHCTKVFVLGISTVVPVAVTLFAGLEETWLRSPSITFITISELNSSKLNLWAVGRMVLSVRPCVMTCPVLLKSSTLLFNSSLFQEQQ